MPPRDYPSGLPGPGCYWCLPPSICASCAAWLPCNSAWIVGGALSLLLRVHCGIKGIALCGVVLPSPPLWNVLALLCTAALRYSSLMFQDPHWASVKVLEHPLWFSCALSPPVLCCLLASLSSFLRVGLSLCWCFCPAPAALPSLLLAASPSLCLWCCVCLDVLLPFLMLKVGDSGFFVV